jgi:hypothetical protein
LATWTAICPALPVAPRISTDCPTSIGTRRRSATQDDMAGFIPAAIFTTSASSGSGMLCRLSMTVRVAIGPTSSSSATKYTRRPSARRPTPSTPGTNGSFPVLV